MNETVKSTLPVETHPFAPFLPEKAKILILGSFPPKKERWSMDFFYPNFNNDMWRIFGLVFFNDKDRFIAKDGKHFDKKAIIDFCGKTGIALYDTAYRAVRLKDNASDKFLEIVTPTDISKLLYQLPMCHAIATTGEKATDTLCKQFEVTPPKVGDFSEFMFENRPLKLYRMPSSSRAYPLSLEKKADFYRNMYQRIGML